MMMTMGHECIWRTVWGDQWGKGKEKERILRDEEDISMIHIYI
jgi:hypothetical protein